MFREIREIKREEKIKDNLTRTAENGYQKIKADTDITVGEANGFWNDLFGSMREED